MRTFKFELKAGVSDEFTQMVIVQGKDEDDAWKAATEVCSNSRDEYEVEELKGPILYAHLHCYDLE